MAGERVPDTWIGASVSVFVEWDSGRLDGDLVEQNDGGIVLDWTPNPKTYPDVQSIEELKNKEPLLMFLPWRVVRFVSISKENIPSATEEAP